MSEENPVLAAMEAYKRRFPRKADAVEAEMTQLEDSEVGQSRAADDDGQPLAGAPVGEQEATSEQSFAVRCDRCGEGIAEWSKAWQKVEGWERHRKAGGTNALALRAPLQEFMCEACMIKEKLGWGQDSLL